MVVIILRNIHRVAGSLSRSCRLYVSIIVSIFIRTKIMEMISYPVYVFRPEQSLIRRHQLQLDYTNSDTTSRIP